MQAPARLATGFSTAGSSEVELDRSKPTVGASGAEKRPPRRAASKSSRDPVAQLHDPIAQLLLRLERSVDLLALAVPPLHGEVELRRLQPRHRQIPARPRPVERLQSLPQPAPWAGQDGHLVGQDRALPGGRLLVHLVEQALSLISNPEQQKRDDTGGERTGSNQRPDEELPH